MPELSPVYLFVPPGMEPSDHAILLGEVGSFREVSSVGELVGVDEQGERPEPGWVFIPEEAGSILVRDLLVRLAVEPGAWSPVFFDKDHEGAWVVPISLGFREDWASAAERLRLGGTASGLLSFRVALEELSRIRHDVNNPLTAALAEIQLLLMDIDENVVEREPLEVVESQLRRIRDLIQELAAFRPLYR